MQVMAKPLVYTPTAKVAKVWGERRSNVGMDG